MTENIFHSVIMCVCYWMITEDGRVGTGYVHLWKVIGIHSTESCDLVVCVTKSWFSWKNVCIWYV